jgi:hypothetical protein
MNSQQNLFLSNYDGNDVTTDFTKLKSGNYQSDDFLTTPNFVLHSKDSICKLLLLSS